MKHECMRVALACRGSEPAGWEAQPYLALVVSQRHALEVAVHNSLGGERRSCRGRQDGSKSAQQAAAVAAAAAAAAA